MYTEFASKGVISIANPNATHLTDYQKQLYLYPMEGTFVSDSDNIYVPNAKYDLSDVRFSDASGNALNYWMRNDGGLHRPTPVDGKTITANGDVKQILPFPGAGIGMFDGTGDYLTLPYDSDFNFGSSDFTIEGWISLNVLSTAYAIITLNRTGIFEGASIWINASNEIYIVTTTNGTSWITAKYITITSGLHHFAAVRYGSTLTFYLDGIAGSVVGTITGSVTGSEASTVNIGATSTGSSLLNGNVSELRISNVARYTAAFPPPRRQLESDSNTKLLLHFTPTGTTFTDSSSSNHTITRYGDTKCITSPVESVGVAYFDGTSDCLTAPTSSDWNFGTNNFTLELNVYFNAITATSQAIFVSRSATYQYNGLFLYVGNTGDLRVAISSNGSSWDIANWVQFTPLNGINIKTWYHIALVRNGSVFTCYINGIACATTITSSSSIYYQNTPIYIGTDYNGVDYPLYGHISEFRISNVARYTSNFTPSTSPFIPDSYTKLLLHFDNYPAPTTFLDDSSGKYETWVKVPLLPASGSTNVNVYWGNANAGSMSNGDGTFDLFDNFNLPTLDTNKWINVTGSGVTVSNSLISCIATSNNIYGIRSIISMGTNITVRTRIKPYHYDSTSYLECMQPRYYDDSNLIIIYYSHIQSGFGYETSIYHKLSGAEYNLHFAGGSSNWFIQEASMTPSSGIYSIDGKNEVTVTTNYFNLSGKVSIFAYGIGSQIDSDWIFVRKYAPTSPTLSTFATVSNDEVKLTGNYESNGGTSGNGAVISRFNRHSRVI